MQYSRISRSIASVRQGGQISPSPPSPLNFESTYGPALDWLVYCVICYSLLWCLSWCLYHWMCSRKPMHNRFMTSLAWPFVVSPTTPMGAVNHAKKFTLTSDMSTLPNLNLKQLKSRSGGKLKSCRFWCQLNNIYFRMLQILLCGCSWSNNKISVMVSKPCIHFCWRIFFIVTS